MPRILSISTFPVYLVGQTELNKTRACQTRRAFSLWPPRRQPLSLTARLPPPVHSNALRWCFTMQKQRRFFILVALRISTLVLQHWQACNMGVLHWMGMRFLLKYLTSTAFLFTNTASPTQFSSAMPSSRPRCFCYNMMLAAGYLYSCWLRRTEVDAPRPLFT